MGKVFRRFCILQGAYWSFQAAVPGFLSAYMLSRGMQASMLGLLLAANLLAAFLGAMFWGRWIDRHQASRRFFLMANASALALGLVCYAFAGQPAVLFVVYPLFGFMNGPIATALDAWVLASFPQRPELGPKARSFATGSYAVVMLVIGILVARVGYWVLPIAGALFLAVSIGTACLQPEIRHMVVLSGSENQKEHSSAKELLHNGKYVLLTAAVLFSGLAATPINNMKVLVFSSVGGDVSFLGWDSFIGCMIQLPFLIFAFRLRKIRAEQRLILGVAAALGYAVMVAKATSPAMVIAGTALCNISFGLKYPSMRELTESWVRPGLRNTAHSVIDTAYGSLAGMISSAWSGVVMEQAGTQVMGLLCAGLATIAVLIGIILLMKKQQPATEICCKAA